MLKQINVIAIKIVYLKTDQTFLPTGDLRVSLIFEIVD
jgi:hypothetical protein